MSDSLEKLGTIAENKFEKRMQGIRFSATVSMVLGCGCILYVIGWLAMQVDRLNIIDSSGYSYMSLLLLGFVAYAQGRSGFDRITESRFIRKLLRNSHNKALAARTAEKEAERLENELDMAREIQMKLLPPRIPQIKGFDLYAVYKPAKKLSSDYYDFLPIGTRDHLGIIVADVSGKGIPGSMVMATTRTVLRFVAAGNPSAQDTMAKTNAIIAADIKRGMFVTAFYLILDARNRTILCASAGHNPMVLHRANGELELVNPDGIALGFDRGPIFNRTIKEQLLQLGSGDRVVLYTDGVVEALNARNEEYTDQRFYDFVKKHQRQNSQDFVKALLNDLAIHRGRAEQNGDITVVTISVIDDDLDKGAAESCTAAVPAAPRGTARATPTRTPTPGSR